MQSIEKALILFFQNVAQKNETELYKLRRFFPVEQGRWCFTLPNLYDFLCKQDEAFNQINYNKFRQLIFNSAVNKTIKELGAEITIVDNQAKVDRSVYALVWEAGQ